MASGRIVAVIGMHRSGTSVIARGLGVLGVELGDRLMPADPGINEKGFWEDLDIHELSESLLRHLGRTWHETTPIPRQDLTGPGADPFVAGAVGLLRTKTAGVPVFGIKNPRSGRLLPFWERVFDMLGAEAGYVIALRHPMSVADSLAARNGFDPVKSHMLWLQHMVSSVLGSAGRPRLVVSYDRLMDDPAGQLRRMALALDLPFDAASAGFAAYARDFLDERLRHSRYGVEHLSAEAVPDEVAGAYRLLDRLAADELSIEAPEVAEEFRRLAAHLEALSPLLGCMERSEVRLEDCERQTAELAGEIAGMHRSAAWRMLAPLRWCGGCWRQLRRHAHGLPALRARAGGWMPLLRFGMRAWRQDGAEAIGQLGRRQMLGAPARPAVAALPPEPAPANSPPAILFVSHEATRTGAPVFLLHLARLVQERLGMSCVFLLCEGGELEERFRALGPTLVCSGRNALDPLLLDDLRRRNIRLIYSNTVNNGFVQRRLRTLGRPILCHIHELGHSIGRHFGEENFRAVAQTTHLFLAGSAAVADYLIRQRSLPPEKVVLAHPFIDVAANLEIVRQAEAPLPDLPAGAVVIGGCGSIGWRKGTDVFVQVARQVLARAGRAVHFVWLGGPLSHGDFRNLHYDAEMTGVAEHMTFTGAVASHLPFLARFDIFVLPSREDPFPLVALDAASLGIPLVCFDKAGGAPELVEADAGRVVPYLDVAGMADAVLELVADDGLRRRLGEAACGKVRARHDVGVGGRRLVEIVQRCLESPGSRKELP